MSFILIKNKIKNNFKIDIFRAILKGLNKNINNYVFN